MAEDSPPRGASLPGPGDLSGLTEAPGRCYDRSLDRPPLPAGDGGDMPKTIVNPPNMAPPTGYSYAVKKTGTPVFVSGQVALDERGQVVGKGDAEAQTEQVFKNLTTVVAACGGSMSDVEKLNVYVTDPAHRPAVAAARLRHFTAGEYPASTYVVVSALAIPELLVEVEAVAMID